MATARVAVVDNDAMRGCSLVDGVLDCAGGMSCRRTIRFSFSIAPWDRTRGQYVPKITGSIL